ncbi:MAG: LptF/LptG family permease [Thermodesulfobacteriota bacterium]|nr:LptF/LptG family permease [Thermodesulfobacteriota bacterium]
MWNSTLSRYLLRQNLFYILTCLVAGTCIYLLSDLFDRLDDFLEAGLGLQTIGLYFLVKIPLILSQILPAVFLLSVVIQLSLMARNRELLALQASGLSFGRLARFFIVYSLLWCLVQLVFSQFIGVYGEQKAGQIWAKQVRKRQIERKELYNIWFREDDFMVGLKKVRPARQQAKGITVFELSPDRGSLERIITARECRAEPGKWVLSQADILDPEGFIHASRDTFVLALRQDLKTFLAVDPDVDPASLPLWNLSGAISRLKASGSNVERLRTVWHMKWAYAFSILAMGLLAMALATLWENIYLNIVVSLVLTFTYYAVFMVGVSAGQKGLLGPVSGAWFGNAVFGLIAGARLLWYVKPHAAFLR